MDIQLNPENNPSIDFSESLTESQKSLIRSWQANIELSHKQGLFLDANAGAKISTDVGKEILEFR